MDAARSDSTPRTTASIDATNCKADAIELTAATKENTKALQQSIDTLAAEIKRQTDFASNVQATETFQLKRMLGDILNGELGGRGVARRFTAGPGT
jgi:prophage DNA circulation protein